MNIEDVKNTVIQGDCLDVLKTFPDDSIDNVITDPPYGLSKEPDMQEVLTNWLNEKDYEHNSTGFMGKCYHPDTSVLTVNGWKPVEEVEIGDKVCSLNIDTEEIEYVECVKTFKYQFDDKLIHIKGRSIEQKVTPNHNLVVRKRHTKKLAFVEADKLTQCFGMSSQGKWAGRKDTTIKIGSTRYDSKDFFYLLGLFLGDGYTVNRVAQKKKQDFWGFSVFKDREVNGVRKVLTELKLKFTENAIVKTSGKDGVIFYVYDKNLLKYLKILGKAKDKYIPNNLFKWDSSLLEFLYQGMMDTDGTTQGYNNQNVYYTVSNRLADDFQRLCLHTGRSCGKTRKKNGKKSFLPDGYSWVLSVVKPNKTFQLEKTSHKKSSLKNYEEVKYKGNVYCVELEKHHILLSRFNGKTVWSGNSWDSFVPSPAIWEEVFRVLKPNGIVASFSGTRTSDLSLTSMRIAAERVKEKYGIDVNYVDDFAWVYGSGFPKSMNIGKALTKKGELKLAEEYTGYGTALKPAHEPVVIFRKQSMDKLTTPDGGTFHYTAKTPKKERNAGCDELYWVDGVSVSKVDYDATEALNEVNKDDKDYKPKTCTIGNNHACLHPESLVLTSKGMKPISEIEIGEKVYSHDGKYHKVLDKFSNSCSNVYDISIIGCNIPVKASDNHPFLIYRPKRSKKGGLLGGEVSWTETKDIVKGDYTMTPISTMESKSYAKKSIEKDSDWWFVAGLWLAEGSLQKAGHGKNKYPVFSLHEDEVDLQEKIKSVFTDVKVSVYTTESKGVHVVVFDPSAGSLLEKLMSSGARNKYISEKVFKLSVEKRLAFIEGYLIGDGWVDHQECKRPSTVSTKLAYQIKIIAESTGKYFGSCFRYAQKGGKIGNREFKSVSEFMWENYLSTKNTQGSGKHKTKPTTITHNGIEYSIQYVKSVEKSDYKGEVINLTVKDTHTFQTAVGMSHNTVKPMKLMRYLIKCTSGGIILDPFAGSGSTLCGAILEGVDSIGIEMDANSVKIAETRMKHYVDNKDDILEAESK